MGGADTIRQGRLGEEERGTVAQDTNARRSPSSGGTVVLVGAGEFLPPIAPVDQALLEGLSQPRHVAIVPTASAPDGTLTFERWLRLGQEHFTALGAEVDPIRLVTRADAENAEIASRLAAANFIYLSGGKPGYLLQTLKGTVAEEALRGVFARGGVVAGCSAGAMALGGETFDFPDRRRTIPALGLAPGLLVIPHFGQFRLDLTELLAAVGAATTVVGIEGNTALVGAGGAWRVLGLGGVTVFHEGQRTRYVEGQLVSTGD